MPSVTEAREAVERGAAYLDEQLPNWEAHIDRTDFAVWSGERCVLAQLAKKDSRLEVSGDCSINSYCQAVKALRPWAVLSGGHDELTEAWVVEHGFYTRFMPARQVLNEAWLRLLEERQARFAVRPCSTPKAPVRSAEDDQAFGDEYYDRPGLDPSLGCE
jgi:hypothetical protein